LVDVDVMRMEESDPVKKKKVLCTKPGGSGDKKRQTKAEEVRRSKRRTSHGLGAKIGELVFSEDRNGGNSLARSSASEGFSTSGGKKN
jgi:hypothetical protein